MLAYWIQYSALVLVVGFAGALVVSTVKELVRKQVRESGTVGSVSVQEPDTGNAL